MIPHRRLAMAGFAITLDERAMTYHLEEATSGEFESVAGRYYVNLKNRIKRSIVFPYVKRENRHVPVTLILPCIISNVIGNPELSTSDFNLIATIIYLLYKNTPHIN